MNIKPSVDGYRQLFVWYLKNSIPVNTAMYKNLYMSMSSEAFSSHTWINCYVKNRVEGPAEWHIG